MKKQPLHIVSFNLPCPPDYGGVIDVFYKLQALVAEGVSVIFHSFTYGRNEVAALENMCEKVYCYPRHNGSRYLFSSAPYIVATRKNEQLINNLCADEAPILFEGLHCTAYLDDSRLKGRFKMVRAHNVEHDYYRFLARDEHLLWRKIYHRSEAIKLKRWEKKLHHADAILTISLPDHEYFEANYGKSVFVPAFHPYEKVKCSAGKGNFMLFHGNLGVRENQKALEFLVQKVTAGLPYRLIVAGKNPGSRLKAMLIKHKNTELYENPSEEVMNQLLMDAQLILLHTFQATGMKLKLLASLFLGRHCIVNSLMVKNTGVEQLCTVADTPDEWNKAIMKKMDEPFDEKDGGHRTEILMEQFDNKKNAVKIIALIAAKNQ